MLNFELNGDVLHVTETINSAMSTHVQHWYYNIKTWQVSSHGKEGDTPDRDMTPSGIKWVQKYYLPKVLDSA